MPYVTAGDPTSSFLLRKIEGSLCDLECKDGACGDRMPKDSDALTSDEQALFRGWIAAGAPDN